MRGLLTVAPAAMLVAAGCLASRGDIETLQTEMRATRAQLVLGDSSILRADAARQAQIAQLSSKIDRALDSLRIVSSRLTGFQANANGNFDSINQQILQIQALLGQTTRNLQELRTQNQALREQGASSVTPPPAAATPTDTSRGGANSGIPGPATLYNSANESINQGAYTTARRSLEQLLTSYPSYELAPRALLRVGETYAKEGNAAASDSVYRLVAERYPKNAEAGLALYRIGKGLWDAGKKSEARTILQRVIRDYPGSDAAILARETLNPRE